MGAELLFFVPGDPQPKERPRARFDRSSGRVQVYTPQATRSWEQHVALCCRAATARVDWTYEPTSRFRVELCIQLRDARRRDIDNITKAVLDGMNGEAWEDDWQVSELTVRRALRHPEPGISVTVYPAPPE